MNWIKSKKNDSRDLMAQNIYWKIEQRFLSQQYGMEICIHFRMGFL
jgi:hypothetical protein